jgi:phosphohistidine phosphatase
MGAERRVILVRHAKSSYPYGVPDYGRPLSGRGRRDAQAAGRWFVREGPRVGLVLCSDATRARHTWEIIRSELIQAKVDAPVQLVVPELYGASPVQTTDLVRALPDDVTNVVIVGHQPTMSATALLLAGAGSASEALKRLKGKFATSSIAVLRFDSAWSELAPGTGLLESFVKPRA